MARPTSFSAQRLGNAWLMLDYPFDFFRVPDYFCCCFQSQIFPNFFFLSGRRRHICLVCLARWDGEGKYG